MPSLAAVPAALQPELGLVAENGFYARQGGSTEWVASQANVDLGWKETALPILQQYQV